MKLVESQLINIQSLLSQRQLGNLPSQPKPKPKKEDVNAVMNKSKRIQEDSEEKEGYFPKVVNDILTEKEQAPKDVEVPTDGKLMPKKEGDAKKEILTSPQVNLPFPQS